MIIVYKSYTRNEAEHYKDAMFIFTDNTMRTLGKNPVDPDSWYAKKYGPRKMCYPDCYTTSVVRGLDNAYPLSIQRFSYANSSFPGGQWHDDEFDYFKEVIDDEFNEIYKNLYKYSIIVLPLGGLFDRENSQITKSRCPKIYEYLKKKLYKLLRYQNS